MSTNPYSKALRDRKKATEPTADDTPPIDEPQSEPVELPPEPVAIASKPISPQKEVVPDVEPVPKKRGRPATGKRSREGWIGRTFYVKEETDLDVEEWLLKLKRKGVGVDKSELVEMLLSAWVKWQQGENLEVQLTDISPIQKVK